MPSKIPTPYCVCLYNPFPLGVGQTWAYHEVITQVIRLHFFFNFYLFIYPFMTVLGLRLCARAFSSCGERGPLSIAVRAPLTVTASLVAEHGSRCAGSVVVAHGLSCSVACGIFPDQGSNPCPLHWQADSQPLRHQGSPIRLHYTTKVIGHSHPQ